MSDSIDQAIIEALRYNARASVTDLSRRVGLSAAATSRRLARLEEEGVIKGYVALVDESRVGSIEAFIQVRLAGTADVAEMERLTRDIDEISELYDVAGEPDLMLRVRVADRSRLQALITKLRHTGKVLSTTTLLVLGSWNRSPAQTAGR